MGTILKLDCLDIASLIRKKPLVGLVRQREDLLTVPSERLRADEHEPCLLPLSLPLIAMQLCWAAERQMVLRRQLIIAQEKCHLQERATDKLTRTMKCLQACISSPASRFGAAFWNCAIQKRWSKDKAVKFIMEPHILQYDLYHLKFFLAYTPTHKLFLSTTYCQSPALKFCFELYPWPSFDGDQLSL